MKLKIYFMLVAVLMFLGTAAAEQQGAESVEEMKRTGTVDMVEKDSFVINDTTVPLTESLQLYDQNGNKTDWRAFKVGDKITMILVEDKAVSKYNVVSIALMQDGGNHPAEEQNTVRPHQEIKKVNGVWINY